MSSFSNKPFAVDVQVQPQNWRERLVLFLVHKFTPRLVIGTICRKKPASTNALTQMTLAEAQEFWKSRIGEWTPNPHTRVEVLQVYVDEETGEIK